MAKHTNRSCVEERTGYSHMRRRCLCSVCAAAAAPLCSLQKCCSLPCPVQKCCSLPCTEMLFCVLYRNAVLSPLCRNAQMKPCPVRTGLSALHIYRLAEGFRKCPGVPTGLSPLPPCCWCHWGQGDTWTWTHGHMDIWTHGHMGRWTHGPLCQGPANTTTEERGNSWADTTEQIQLKGSRLGSVSIIY